LGEAAIGAAASDPSKTKLQIRIILILTNEGFFDNFPNNLLEV